MSVSWLSKSSSVRGLAELWTLVLRQALTGLMQDAAEWIVWLVLTRAAAAAQSMEVVKGD